MNGKESSESRYGSASLDKLAERLSGTPDPRKRYEYVLWLAKKLPDMPPELQTDDRKVQGCVSQVFIDAQLDDGCVLWQGAEVEVAVDTVAALGDFLELELQASPGELPLATACIESLARELGCGQAERPRSWSRRISPSNTIIGHQLISTASEGCAAVSSSWLIC